MAGTYGGVGGETETSAPVEPSSRSARRRRMEVHQFNIVPTDMAVNPPENGRKRPRIEAGFAPVQSCGVKKKPVTESGESNTESLNRCGSVSLAANIECELVQEVPKFGLTSVCGRRRDMEDAVAVHPSFCSSDLQKSSDLHFYGVYDGHGCSHVSNFNFN